MPYENDFVVLPDGKTIVGSDGTDPKKLMMEDITKKNPRQIMTHNKEIGTLLFDSLTQSLLVGDGNGHVTQYKKENGSFTMVKEYGNVGVGGVMSHAQVRGFAIFAGDNRSLIAIDIKNQKLVKRYVETAYEFILSLQVCLTNNHRIFLTVSGWKPDFSSGKSDIFDVTCMAIKDSSSLQKFPFKDLSKANETILIQQMAIESKEETISKLKKYEYEIEIYKQKLDELENKYKYMKEASELIFYENQITKNSFLLLEPRIEFQNKRLISKLFMIDNLRKQYTHHLHNPPKFTSFDREDQSQTILKLEEEIQSLGNQQAQNLKCLQQSIQIQKKNKKDSESLRSKKEKIKKQLIDFQGFIKNR